VAVVDTGIDWDHPDLNVTSGTEYGGYNEPGEPGSDGAPDVNNNGFGSGHGTHVAGIIAADGSSGQQMATVSSTAMVWRLALRCMRWMLLPKTMGYQHSRTLQRCCRKF